MELPKSEKEKAKKLMVPVYGFNFVFARRQFMALTLSELQTTGKQLLDGTNN